MRRREFIALVVTGAAIASSSSARSEPSSNPIVGFVHARSRDVTLPLVAAFQRGLAENGLVIGQNVTVEYRFADGDYARLPSIVSELVSRPVNVLVTGADPAAIAGKKAAGSIPMVFVVGGDPVALGLVSTLNRPGGNETGMTILTTLLEPKRLGLFREILPPNTTIGALFNPSLPLSQKQSQAVQEAARAIDQKVQIFWASNDAEMASAFNTILGQHIGALMVAADPFFDTRRDALTGWSAQHKIPTVFQFRDYAIAGGLMSYGIDLPDVYRQIGGYTARIIKGEKPSDLPVMEPIKFELVINLKTAKTLGLTLPPGLMSIADEVIE